MADVKAIAEELVNLSVKDVQELAKVLKEEYGIEPAATVVAAAAPRTAAPAALSIVFSNNHIPRPMNSPPDVCLCNFKLIIITGWA